MIRIQFIDSPTGEPYNLAYSAGQLVSLPDELAKRLIADKIAVLVAEETRTTKAQVSEKRATVQSNNPAKKRAVKSGNRKKSS